MPLAVDVRVEVKQLHLDLFVRLMGEFSQCQSTYRHLYHSGSYIFKSLVDCATIENGMYRIPIILNGTQ